MAGGKRYDYCGFKMSHGSKQRDYLEWKAERINSLLGRKCRVLEDSSKKTERSRGFQGFTYKFMGAVLEPYYRLLYPNGKKQITPELLTRLGMQELAVLWMDDGTGGTYEETYKWKLKSGETRSRARKVGRMELAVCHCDVEELSLLRLWIKGLTGVLPGIKGLDRNRRLTIPLSDACEFASLLRPYFEPSMLYKLNLVDDRHQRVREIGG
jgi:hypothetical protein